jgi:hypothetical protein
VENQMRVFLLSLLAALVLGLSGCGEDPVTPAGKADTAVDSADQAGALSAETLQTARDAAAAAEDAAEKVAEALKDLEKELEGTEER